jgi:hypothetical protein
LYANFPMRSTLIFPISQAFRDDSPASGERAIAADRDRFAVCGIRPAVVQTFVCCLRSPLPIAVASKCLPRDLVVRFDSPCPELNVE